MTADRDSSSSNAGSKPKVRTHTPRPDELTQDVLEFISAIQDYKRRNMRSFLEDAEILRVFLELGYSRSNAEDDVTDAALEAFAAVRERYRVEEGRLFPTWSEVFNLLNKIGYERDGED